MKKIIYSFIIISLLISCGNDKKGTMKVHGTINGLKKGTIYLQKYKDTLLVSLDSVKLNGENNFTLVDDIESPEIYFVVLDNNVDKKISFFGEKGEITLTSKLDKFATSAKILGSKNQTLLEEHEAMIQKFNGKQLDLIKDKFEAKKAGDTEFFTKLEKDEKSLIRRKYYFSTNFAVNHGEYEVAPYIALTELYYANIRLLDTINNSLSKKVKASKYGLELKEFIDGIKKNEN
ncbi:MAG: DUF4369 domain-containing protein [Lutibacter sp.]|uniref:DUF4369 domain-containing protein n=1 Tax=Lutibacter sp. TaxID=1925666 RepID=UPI00385DEE53